MSFFMAVILGIAVYIGIQHGRNNTLARESAATKVEQARRSFEDQYGDEDLEASLKQMINDAGSRNAIWNEVSPILHELDDWKDFDREKFDRQYLGEDGEYRYFYERLVLDILMVNRGKLSKSLMNGWHGWLGLWKATAQNTSKDLQLAKWIVAKIRETYPGLTLMVEYMNTPAYAWVGTVAEQTMIHELKREVVV